MLFAKLKSLLWAPAAAAHSLEALVQGSANEQAILKSLDAKLVARFNQFERI
jgi:hypothetical protein